MHTLNEDCKSVLGQQRSVVDIDGTPVDLGCLSQPALASQIMAQEEALHAPFVFVGEPLVLEVGVDVDPA